jgi:formate hydrogenlyase subunit 6/NADH:ubiquinone oxidoreductase subunit I
VSTTVTIDVGGFDQLLAALRGRGFEPVGPTIRGETIVYDRIAGVQDLPVGWTDRQQAGTYRLERRKDEALFGYVVGPHSFKKYLFPSRHTLFTLEKTADGVKLVDKADPVPRFAFIGVRPCELAALDIQDRVFGEGPFIDPEYVNRRQRAFVVTVNCVVTGGTCFCTSMGTGPRAREGFDLSATEILDASGHRFLIEAGSPRGEEVLADVPHRPAEPEDLAEANRLLELAAASMGRSLDTNGIKELLLENLEHPRWERVGEQCLTCTNCTMVCPTCFCATVEDAQSLDGLTAERSRHWDSCFSKEFSYIHGGSMRTSPAARYRQWMTHKLASWIDQFGMSGCVGCGRCITWCPVGIDITKIAAVIRTSEEKKHALA